MNGKECVWVRFKVEGVSETQCLDFDDLSDRNNPNYKDSLAESVDFFVKDHMKNILNMDENTSYEIVKNINNN